MSTKSKSHFSIEFLELPWREPDKTPFCQPKRAITKTFVFVQDIKLVTCAACLKRAFLLNPPYIQIQNLLS